MHSICEINFINILRTFSGWFLTKPVNKNLNSLNFEITGSYMRVNTVLQAIGESLLTSLFTFFLPSIQPNSKKPWPYIWTKCKSWKSWLSWAVCAIFSSSQAILKEISTIKNCDKAIHSLLDIEFLEENFSETIRCIGLKFSKITKTVIPFQYSEFIFYRHQTVISTCWWDKKCKQRLAYTDVK